MPLTPTSLNLIFTLLYLLNGGQEPYRTERRLVEYFSPLPTYIWDLSLTHNSCTSVDQVRCILRVERRRREIIEAPVYPEGFKMEEDTQKFRLEVDRFSAFYWKTLGYILPFEEGVREDILSCNRMDWLPPSYPSPVSVFAWTFQDEFANPMFPGEADTLQYTLVAKGVRLDFLDDSDFLDDTDTPVVTPAHMDFLSMPPQIHYYDDQHRHNYSGNAWGGSDEALEKISRSDSTEFVFLSSDFKDHPLALERDKHFCTVGFSLGRLYLDSARTMGEVSSENPRPISPDSRDVHQVLIEPEAFRGIAPVGY